MIIAGAALGMFTCINLEDDKRSPEYSGNVFRKHEKPPTEMIEVKKVSTSAKCSRFLTLCKDNVIREYDMTS